MSTRVQFEVPARMRAAQEQFEEWRSSHSGRRPIPETLWNLAVEVAREHGLFRTTQVLRLDYNRLKQRMPLAVPQEKAQASMETAFVEWMEPPSTSTCECVLELEGPRGRMRIEWKGSTTPDLTGLCRALWEPGA
jgi:hypothetical protein